VRQFLVHCLYLDAHVAFTETEVQKYKLFKQGEELRLNMAVHGGTVLEVCVAQFWSSIGDSSMDLKVHFKGVLPDSNEVCIGSADHVKRVSFASHLQNETISPSAVLDRVQSTVHPTEGVIRPMLPGRDVLPNGKQIHELTLVYPIEVKEKGKLALRCPLLNGFLYEAEYGSQLCMLHDCNKKMVWCADAWPSPSSLLKGKYTARLHVTHDSLPMLEKLKAMPIVVETVLPKYSPLIHPPSA
jgi:tripeptidyl-peptidase-2